MTSHDSLVWETEFELLTESVNQQETEQSDLWTNQTESDSLQRSDSKELTVHKMDISQKKKDISV